jgi:hypothetical protein
MRQWSEKGPDVLDVVTHHLLDARQVVGVGQGLPEVGGLGQLVLLVAEQHLPARAVAGHPGVQVPVDEASLVAESKSSRSTRLSS